MMQRGSSSTMARNILIGSISVIMLLVVLYYLKRVEVGRLKHDMDDMLLQRSEREDELNRKLTEYLQKLEDMTRQLGDINSRLQECEDNKASTMMDLQKCKNVNTECLSTKEGADSSLKAAQAELNTIKAQHETVNSQLGSYNRDLASVKHSLADAERELQQSEDEKDACVNSLRTASGQVQECQQRELACQSSLRAFNQGQGAARLPGQPLPVGGGAPFPRVPSLNLPRQPPQQPAQQPQALVEEGDIPNVVDHLGGAEEAEKNSALDQLEENNGDEEIGGNHRVIGEDAGGEDRAEDAGEDRVIGDGAGEDRVIGDGAGEDRVIGDGEEGGVGGDGEDNGGDRVIDGADERVIEEEDRERNLL